MASLNPDSALNNGVGSVADHALEPFFGKVDPQYQRMLAEDKFAHDTYNLPKAYEGKNKYLENVIQFMITEDDDWYTRYVLPWVASDDLTLTWNIFRFNRTLMDLEPHQGVPRYVTAEREARSDRMVRRGLAFIIEHGFYKTDQGRQHYLMNLKQIVDSVNLTAYHGVIHALLSSKPLQGVGAPTWCTRDTPGAAPARAASPMGSRPEAGTRTLHSGRRGQGRHEVRGCQARHVDFPVQDVHLLHDGAIRRG